VTKAALNFHETFPPEREHIGRLLLLAEDMEFMTKEEIFTATGIPTGKSSGKVVPHIYYAEYMGLLNVEQSHGRFRLSRTLIGQEVSGKDPYLLETASQLICHCGMTSRNGAALWEFIFREFLVSHGPIVSRDVIERSAQARFGTKVNLSPFVSCYTRNTSFGSLRLLDVSKNRSLWSFNPHKYEHSFSYLYAYSLLSEWDRTAPDTSELTLDFINTQLRWGSAFLWDSAETLETLSALQELGVVKLNRQLEPVTIIRTINTRDAVQNLYKSVV